MNLYWYTYNQLDNIKIVITLDIITIILKLLLQILREFQFQIKFETI